MLLCLSFSFRYLCAADDLYYPIGVSRGFWLVAIHLPLSAVPYGQWHRRRKFILQNFPLRALLLDWLDQLIWIESLGARVLDFG